MSGEFEIRMAPLSLKLPPRVGAGSRFATRSSPPSLCTRISLSAWVREKRWISSRRTRKVGSVTPFSVPLSGVIFEGIQCGATAWLPGTEDPSGVIAGYSPPPTGGSLVPPGGTMAQHLAQRGRGPGQPSEVRGAHCCQQSRGRNPPGQNQGTRLRPRLTSLRGNLRNTFQGAALKSPCRLPALIGIFRQATAQQPIEGRLLATPSTEGAVNVPESPRSLLAVLAPSNARLPVSISDNTQPNEKISARTSVIFPCRLLGGHVLQLCPTMGPLLASKPA